MDLQRGTHPQKTNSVSRSKSLKRRELTVRFGAHSRPKPPPRSVDCSTAADPHRTFRDPRRHGKSGLSRSSEVLDNPLVNVSPNKGNIARR
jgi:hypothetical protein